MTTPERHLVGSERVRRPALFWVTRTAARRVLIGVHAAAALAVLVEVFVPFAGEPHAVERVHALDFIGSYAVYGFVACVVLVLLGIGLRRLVIHPEDYYGRTDTEGDDA
jgi:hypothetical protein